MGHIWNIYMGNRVIYGNYSLSSGKLSHNYGISPCSMGKSTISMVMFNSYVNLPDGIHEKNRDIHRTSRYMILKSTGIMIRIALNGIAMESLIGYVSLR